jgi:hypothetical protein
MARLWLSSFAASPASMIANMAGFSAVAKVRWTHALVSDQLCRCGQPVSAGFSSIYVAVHQNRPRATAWQLP